jgi:hypothetical protein
MKFGLVFPLTLVILHATGQRLFRSRPETKEFDRFHFRVVTRKNKIPQHDSRYNRLGYASLVADGRLYSSTTRTSAASASLAVNA